MFGHITFFWNGNRSGYFNPTMGEYVEVPSDSGITFNVQTKMKALEIAEKARDAIPSHKFDQVRVNLPNLDMVGHTGDIEATVMAYKSADEVVKMILDAVEQATVMNLHGFEAENILGMHLLSLSRGGLVINNQSWSSNSWYSSGKGGKGGGLRFNFFMSPTCLRILRSLLLIQSSILLQLASPRVFSAAAGSKILLVIQFCCTSPTCLLIFQSLLLIPSSILLGLLVSARAFSAAPGSTILFVTQGINESYLSRVDNLNRKMNPPT